MIKLFFLLFCVNTQLIFSGEFAFETKEDFQKLHKSGIKIEKESAKVFKLSLARKKMNLNRELYLNFENSKASELKDLTGHYNILSSTYSVINEKNLVGKRNASFASTNSFISVATSNGRLFDSSFFKEAFYISFFVLPGESEQYASVFSKNYFTEGKKIGIECNILNNKIEVNFSNMFQYSSSETKSISLKSDDKLSTESWTHIVIFVDPLTGKVRLIENGKIKSETEATRSLENPTPLSFGFHKNDTTPLIIGKNFFGKLDDFLVGLGQPNIDSFANPFYSVEYDDINKYASQKTGMAYSKVLESKNSFSKLLSIDKDPVLPSGTELDVSFRLSKTIFDKDDTEIPWLNIDDYEKYLNIDFKYFQWKLVMKANHDGSSTPALKKIRFKYLDSMPPNKPSGLSAKLGNNNSVCLKWTSNHEENVRDGGNYLIHYGLSPERMVGTISVNANGEKITGLSNGLLLEKNYRNLTQCIDNDLISKNAMLRKDKNLLILRSGLTYYFKISACNKNYDANEAGDQRSKLSEAVLVNMKSE